MKRNSVVNLIVLLIFCLSVGGFIIFYGIGEDVPYSAPTVVAALDTPDWIVIKNVGKSMEPWIPDGSLTRAYSADVPVVGDVVVFDCLVKKCADFDGSIRGHSKFLRKIDARGCYWFEGRTDEYIQDGVLSVSRDSRTHYGYLCPGEFNVLGVVRDLPEGGSH